MRSLENIEHIGAGAIGVPGRRRFFIHVRAAAADHWFLMEKQQVAVVSERILELLAEAGYEGEGTATGTLPDFEPDEIDFRVGEMALGLMEEAGTLVFTFFPVDGEEAEPVTFEAPFDLVGAMAGAGLGAVVSGRPPCPRCNLPMDADGHTCPASNGDLRRQRS